MIAAIAAFVRRHLDLELTYRNTMHDLTILDTDNKEIF